MSNKVKLSEYCKSIRDKSGLNKADFANKIGISDVQVGKIEHGSMDSPTFLVLFRIYKAYGLTIDDLKNNIDFSHMGDTNFLSSFEYYLKKETWDIQSTYLIDLFTMFLENNGYSVEYPQPLEYMQNNKSVFSTDIKEIEYNPYCLKGTKSNSNVVYGYIINSTTQIKSFADQYKLNKEIDTIINNIVHPNFLINPKLQKKYSFMPGLKEKNNFDLYFITGSKTVYDEMLKHRNTFQLLNFNIYCLYSRYKDNWEYQKLN